MILELERSQMDLNPCLYEPSASVRGVTNTLGHPPRNLLMRILSQAATNAMTCSLTPSPTPGTSGERRVQHPLADYLCVLLVALATESSGCAVSPTPNRVLWWLLPH